MKRRLFIALPLSHKIQQLLYDATLDLRKKFPELRFELPEKLHITLKFLGWTDKPIEEISEALTPIARHSLPIHLATTTFGAFAGTRLVAYIGLSENPVLTRLATAIDDVMATMGFEPETRAFHAHVTIARGKGKTPLHWRETARQIKKFPFNHSFQFTAYRIVLMQSTLTPSGSEYQVIKTFLLKSNKLNHAST